MALHRGEIVERIVRQSGFVINKIAEQLGITRNTLYSRFKDPELNYDFIKRVGSIIHYNFSINFPEIKVEDEKIGEDHSLYLEKNTADLLALERKHRALLEKYHKLLILLTGLANSNDLVTIKEEILAFVESTEL